MLILCSRHGTDITLNNSVLVEDQAKLALRLNELSGASYILKALFESTQGKSGACTYLIAISKLVSLMSFERLPDQLRNSAISVSRTSFNSHFDDDVLFR